MGYCQQLSLARLQQAQQIYAAHVQFESDDDCMTHF